MSTQASIEEKAVKQLVIDKTNELIEQLNVDIQAEIDKQYDDNQSLHTLFSGQNLLHADTTKVRKYVKIKRRHSVVAFVDTTTGNVYKPASYSAPAKHARGSVFSTEGGREAFTSVNTTGLVHVKYL